MQEVDVESTHSVAQLQVASDAGQVAGAVKHVLVTVAYVHPTFSFYHHLLVSTWCVLSPCDNKNSGSEFSFYSWFRAVERDILTRRRSGRQLVRPVTQQATRHTSVGRREVSNPISIGGWWTRPANWKANTAIAFAGIFTVAYGVFTVSADKEVRSPSSLYTTTVGIVILRNSLSFSGG